MLRPELFRTWAQRYDEQAEDQAISSSQAGFLHFLPQIRRFPLNYPTLLTPDFRPIGSLYHCIIESSI